MKKFESLDIPEASKHAIANGIFVAVTHDIPDLVYENKLPTNNGSSIFRWNFISRNIMDNLDGAFQISIVKRGPWKFLLLYNPDSRITFSVMTEGNLSRLRRYLPKNPHYLESLISENTGYEPIEGQLEIKGFPKVSRDFDQLSQLREQLLSGFSGIIENHILILFDYSFDRVISARAVLLTPDMKIAFDEDWSHLLTKPYIISKTPLSIIADESEEPLVKLKKRAEENSDVSIRKDDDIIKNSNNRE